MFESARYGLYLHVPFCLNKCGYCDFNSWEESKVEPMRQWAEGIEEEFRFWQPHLQKNHFDTVFFGGGTPSLVPNALFAKVVGEMKRVFQFDPDFEWTVECNPETISRDKLEFFAELGVTRLSLGIQSFDDRYLKLLERRADRKINLHALETLQKYWKGRYSFDLMFGLPEQNIQELQSDLDLALSFDLKHLSIYQLTLTTQRSQNWKQASESVLREMYDLVETQLARKSLRQYEVSNYAVEGQECRHNLKYWRLEPFLGTGPGAYGLTHLSPEKSGTFGFHQKNADSLENWAQGKKTFEERSQKNHLFEMLMMGLRLREGIPTEKLERVAPGLLSFLTELIASKNYLELLSLGQNLLRTTPKGLRVLDFTLKQLFYDLEKRFFASGRDQIQDSASIA